MATRPKAVIESRNGEKFSPITITKNVLTDDGQSLHDILSDKKEDMMTPTIENSSSMFKVGQGDNVDYSANVVNGAYESMVLKGKTMVNYIQEPSSQDVVLPYEFADGQYVTINDTKESGALGVELKGQTLVNATGEPIVNLVINSSSPKYLRQHTLKKDTVYTFIYDIEEVTGGASGSWGRFNYTDGTYKNVLDKPYTTGITKVATSFNKDLDHIYIGWIRSHAVGQSVKFKSVMILEGDWTNKELPSYFTGMTSCKMPILHTVGKNLIPSSLIANTGLTWADGTQYNPSSDYQYTSTGFIKIQTGLYYTSSNANNIKKRVHCYDKNKIYLGVLKTDGSIADNADNVNLANTFKIDNENVRYIRLTFYGVLETAQLEQGSVATAYEAHKSSILSLPEEVVLRSLPNGVCDTFNTRTGVYTQRVGAMVLNGSDPITSRIKQADNILTTTSRCYLDYASIPSDIRMKPFPSANEVSNKLICDILPVKAVVPDMQQDDIESVGQTTAGFSIRVKGKTIAECRQRLAEQPITIQYELATPIITKINLSSTLKSWNSTTHIYSEIPENTLYPTLSHSNPSYPVILKPNTKYSIVANSYSNSHTNSAINFNLGGATASTRVGNRVITITTPSTLSNALLTMGGRGNKLNNVMVVEGDVVGDEPYFEGICDCKSPILSNIGKNLFDGLSYIDGFVASGNDYTVSYDADVTSILVKVNKNTDYILSAKTSFNRSLVGGSLEPISIGTKTTNLNAERISNTIKFNSGEYTNVIIYLNSSKIDIEDIQVEEGSVSTTYEPYKSNILSCNGDKVELTENMFEQGTINETHAPKDYNAIKTQSSGAYFNKRIRLKSPLPIKPNTTYIINVSNNYDVFVGFCLDGVFLDNYIGYKGNVVFTTPSNCNEIALVIKNGNDEDLLIANFSIDNIRLSEVDKTIALRSLPNGVCDTLNVETGEYVQRIGEIVLDGEFNLWAQSCEDVQYYRVGTGTINNFKLNSCIINDKLPVAKKVTSETKGEFVGDHTNSQSIHIRLLSSKLSQRSVDGVQEYLRANPITVQYELETPITTKVDVQGFPHAYKNGHVVLSSGSIEQSLTPKVEYSVATNRNGQIRSNQKMVERHQKQLDRLQAMILTNLVNTQYEQTLTNLKYDLKNVREEVK